MTESVSSADLAAPTEWRRESNRQREVALRLAAEYQLKENVRRAKVRNELLNRVEQQAPLIRDDIITTESVGISDLSVEAPAELAGTPAESTKSLFKEGDQV
ncbi:Hypothetical protein PHPALM_20909 [Phytophthora palmivora]|uniref:Uncharacterized protein n=1 Tax=Phytophthora palmivora TaxID=4796 RepID=A0A2P4XDN5_9STRA|nr:Hypothetical protein PHPALM_20909 [Phytophthora palmivora]